MGPPGCEKIQFCSKRRNGILPYEHRHKNHCGHDHYLVCGILGSLTDHSKMFFSGWNWTPTNGYLFAYKDIEVSLFVSFSEEKKCIPYLNGRDILQPVHIPVY